MTDDDESPLRPKETHSDESFIEYLLAEPTFLGDEQLLIIGRGILTDIGDIVDVLAIDSSETVHVIFLPHGKAGPAALDRLIPQGAWVSELDERGVRSIFAGYRNDFTLDELFGSMFGCALPKDVNHRQILTVVAPSFDAEVFEALEDLADRSDGLVRAVSFREFEDGEDVLVQTKRVV